LKEVSVFSIFVFTLSGCRGGVLEVFKKRKEQKAILKSGDELCTGILKSARM
jgi:hypothetical protein